MRVGLRISVVCGALLLAPAAAQAGFSPDVVSISGESDISAFPEGATNAQGEAIVVWFERVSGTSRLRFRRVRPDGSLGETVTVSDGTMIPTQREVAFAPGGRALVVWNESATGAPPRFLRARWIEPDDSMGAQIPLRNAGIAASAESPDLAATTDGDAVVGWRNSASTPINRTEARRVDGNGALGPLLEPPEGPGTPGVAVAPTAAGGTLLAWAGPPTIRTMPVNAAGAAGPVQTPVATGVTSLATRLATDGQDRFHLLWPPAAGPDQLAALALDATGAAAGLPQSVESGVAQAAFPNLATNAANRSLAFWSRNGEAVVARYIAPDGVPEPATFSAPAEVQLTQDVALLGDGTGVLLWSQGPLGMVSGLCRIIGGDGVAAAPQPLSASGALSSSLAVSPGGVGLVAWEQRIGSSGQSQVQIRQLLPPPSCPDASATVVQGRPTLVTLACSGFQLTGPEVLSSPAEGTLGAVNPATSSVLYTPRPGFQGSDSFTFRGTGKGGAGAVQTARITVGKDTVAPVVRTFRLDRKRVRLRTAFLARAKRKPAFTLAFSEPSTVAIAIQRKRGKRFRTVGTLRLRTAATTATIRLPKRFGRRALQTGAYRARVTATDLAQNRSKVKGIRFRVTRR